MNLDSILSAAIGEWIKDEMDTGKPKWKAVTEASETLAYVFVSIELARMDAAGETSKSNAEVLAGLMSEILGTMLSHSTHAVCGEVEDSMAQMELHLSVDHRFDDLPPAFVAPTETRQ